MPRRLLQLYNRLGNASGNPHRRVEADMRIARPALFLILPALSLGAQEAAGPGAGEWIWVKTEQPSGTPGLCFEGAGAFDRSAGKLVLFGGHGTGYGQSERSDTWLYDPAVNRWEKAEPANRPVGSCCARETVYDEANRRTYFFGGHSHAHGWQWKAPKLRASNPWAYDASKNTWVPMKPQAPRPKSPWTGAAYDREHQVVVTYGGEGFSRNEVWVFDGYANSWTSLPRKGDGPANGGRCPPMVFDEDRRVVLMYANGDAEGAKKDELWTYDLATNTWASRKDEGGPRRTWPLMVWDPQNRAPLLFSSDNKGPMKAFAYRWDENTWVELPARGDAPPAYAVQQGAYDPLNHQTLFANGGSYNVKNQPGTYLFKHARPKDAARPSARPEELRVVTAPDRARIEWRPVAGASRYAVYRGAGPVPWEVRYEKVGESEKTEFDDARAPKGTLSHYFVRAVDAGGREGPASLKVRTQPPVPEQPAVSVAAKDRVEIEWPRRAEPDIAGYYVYRVNGTQVTKLNADLLKENRLTDSHPVPGGGDVSIRYVVRAVNLLGVESGPSSWATTVPGEPTGLRARREEGRVLITWRANPERHLKGYNVYRVDDRSAKDPKKVGVLVTEPRWVDASKTDDAICKYYVTAVDLLDQEGFASYGAWFNDNNRN